MAALTAQRPSHSNFLKGNRGMVESATKMATNLTALPSLSHTELKSLWTETFGSVPPKGLSRRLLICALAYEIQAKNQGRLKPTIRRRLLEIATSDTPRPTTEASPLTPGTRLMREWRGTVHVVDVTEDGPVWNGRAYNSLSAIARTITGTRWSGNRFFGVRKRSDAVKSRTHSTENVVREDPEGAPPHSGETGCSNNGSVSPQLADTAAYGAQSSPADTANLVAESETATPNAAETDLEALPALEPEFVP